MFISTEEPILDVASSFHLSIDRSEKKKKKKKNGSVPGSALEAIKTE